MKEVRAYIKAHRLSEVTLALHEIQGLTGMSVLDSRGFGRGHLEESRQEHAEDAKDYVANVRIEIICTDQLVERIVTTIQKHAHTGLRGDGKIYIYTVEEAIRISTAERGEAAV